jgi:hypothetical protein
MVGWQPMTPPRASAVPSCSRAPARASISCSRAPARASTFSACARNAVCGALLTLGVSFAAQAQVGEHGKITTRSDVRMSIEGATGTSGKKLDALAKVLGGPLSELKKCYAEIVKENPEVVGNLTVELTLVEGKEPIKATPDSAAVFKPMKRCVDKAFAKLDVSEVPRPAKAKLALELTNSAAAGAGEVKTQGEIAAKVPIEERSDGTVASHGKSLQGEVSFEVSAKGPSGRDAVEHIHNGVRDALPGLFDCRRRAAKKGSPEGDLVFQLKLTPSAKPNVDVTSSTVQNERAPVCSSSVLKRSLPKGGSGRVALTIHFHPEAAGSSGDASTRTE